MRVRIASLLGMLAVHVDGTSAFLFPISSNRVLTRRGNLCAHDVTVTLTDGLVRTVTAEDGQTLLEALEAHDIDAPHSCRSGLCTE